MIRMGRADLLIAFFIFFAGCAPLPKKSVGPSLRIATYNVNNGNNSAALVSTLAQINADILCLQEADEFQDAYRQALTNTFPYIYIKPSESNPGAGYAFLSKFPGHEIAWIKSNDWFGGWIVKFETPLGPIQILNVHLHPPVKYRSWIKGYFLTRQDRLREIQEFFPAAEHDTPLIVAGDFNDTSHSRAIRFLRRKGFTDALPRFDHTSPTWTWRIGPLKLRRRIDHLVYSPQLDCISAEVKPIGSSDHFPVLGTFVQNSAPNH